MTAGAAGVVRLVRGTTGVRRVSKLMRLHATSTPYPLGVFRTRGRAVARATPYASAMAYEQKTLPSGDSVSEFLHSVEPARRRAQGLQLLDIFRAETGAEPRMWGPSIVGFGHVRYAYATGHSGEMGRVGFSPRKAALSLYGLTLYGSNADLLEKLGKHRPGKGCLYVNKLEDVDLDVLRELIRRGWADTDTFTDTHPHAVVEPVDPALQAPPGAVNPRR